MDDQETFTNTPERKKLREWYSNPLWGPKVDHIPDGKIPKVLDKLQYIRTNQGPW